jgi:NhaP-type Na+/H+ or K+/H+ antiporter
VSRLLIWSLWSRTFRRATVNGPIVMTGLGLIAGAVLPTQGILFMESKATLFLAEIVLAFLLFVDALDVRGSVRSQFTGVPARLLGIGLPVARARSGGRVGSPLGLSVAVVLAIACISVPADFSPETSLVRDERIPARAALAQCRERLQRRPRLSAPARRARIRLGGNHGRRRARLRRRGPAGLIAVLVGAAVGAAIGGVTRFADERGWTEPQSMRIAFIAAPLIVFAAAVMLHGNGFVAVFVAGIAIRLTRGRRGWIELSSPCWRTSRG